MVPAPTQSADVQQLAFGMHVLPQSLKPEAQAVHWPAPLHVKFPAHEPIPLGTFDVNTHTDTPVAHDVVPFWQMLPPGVQPWLATQLLQVPLAQ